MTYTEAIQNLLCCIELDYTVSGFTYNESFPSVNTGSLWRDFLKYLLDGTLPPSTRVFCGVSIPAFPLSGSN